MPIYIKQNDDGTANIVDIGTGSSVLTVDSSTGDVTVPTGNLKITTAGKGLQIETGAVTDRLGTSTLVAGTVTVANTSAVTADKLFLSRATTGGTTGHLSYTLSSGTSFTINSTSNTDTSTINWLLVKGL